ncbi:ectonucleoside triphosphate diphosphohydrolase 1 isoform X2 [Scleropages formosus]|uniref:Ectonucleoside triphosphate diphosphohydrolase 1 n=1 Tax=Scleropages formosus TaxID=113540 RepID=A0A8C9S970_SCLFO|nr:ectonucleoside triphosphate diphosphohydrolase 1 isoform X2 [Scleropages formosus]
MAGQREMREKNTWHRPLIICIAVFFVMAIVGLLITGVVQNKAIKQKYKYGIVLDAGSSHTSVYVYQWPAEKENNTGMVTQKHVCNVKGKGISSYAKNAEKAGPSLKECMQEAERSIPTQRHQETPVYLGATAGMRLLRKEDDSASDRVLDSVVRFLQGTPFTFQGARIITGQEEGAYGWITVNYLSDNFRKAQRTMGALDLGGASTQITFESGDHSQSPDDFIHFRLYGKEYSVYTHSFLCYGKDQALRVLLDQQLRANLTGTGSLILQDPCFHPGYKKVKLLADVYNTPCIRTGPSSNVNFTHVGTGNGKLCQEKVRRIFNSSGCSSRSCSFNGVFQPPLHGQFEAFSAFFFVMKFLNLTSESLEDSKKKLVSYCSTPWDELQKNNHNVKEKYLQEYCFSGTYIVTLLEEGYSFTSGSWKDIRFIKKIGDSDVGWTLGYMLNLTNMIPAEAPDSPPLPHGGYVTLMVLLALLVCSLVVCGCCVFRRSSSAAPKQIV